MSLLFIKGKNMKYKLIFPILALLCVSLVIPIVLAANGSKAESGTFTITGYGIGRRLSGFACGSGSGMCWAVWSDLNPIDQVCETLTELKLGFDSGSLRARWYDGSWHRSTMPLAGISGSWGASEITGSGDVWTITDSTGYGAFTLTWDAGHTSATIQGSIKLSVDGVTIVLRIRGTAAFNPV